MKTLFACLLIVFAILPGCYYDSKENLYPVLDSACTDTVNVTYSSSITPILNNYCVSCHSGSNPGGNINLQDYNTVKALVDNGQLLSSINHTGSVVPMPLNGGKLDNCKIAVFEKWILLKAPNN
jgi:hypothetical protein